MVDGEKKKRAPGRPRRLGPETIVAAARRIIDEEGVEAVSMRRVAREVGSTPMALYHHVRDKDELLLLTLAGTSTAVPRPALPADPRERMIAVAVHMHGLLKRMPWVLKVLALGDLTDPKALWMAEEIVQSALDSGLDEARAVRAYRTVWHFVYGDLVLTAARERRAADPDRRPSFPSALTGEDARELPRLTELAGRWEELQRYDVREQLTAIVDGLLGPARAARG
ncbi:TetR/AcrR family transcriptional regulator [Streptomyces clavuligerus]|uniref:TetR/AcrR family transcriptional regulator n=1 Tax=Streptomyces clavuligerus TaxID=1901 RepID=UPI00020D9188|nr:TetR/AcrR family transcriptional regulator [Streptomyces clavuligerus]ANW18585.1 TetR family transcriptional regulator [Streptomyces clavuligerus]AXU13146.1 TetR/AcrR family transcriptional regulator [Streptomyces clavuligerus]MBY6303088.1 TetR/AcrR family transcriptional regulator [Streptomyces clavuligerus]QCS05929.1 TetR/AcrR family transcriptional regulator [Streptomyces clavuligerus]QPJ94706.1 TetR family transcriptional regulator [Streptomyces clavuligerus]